MTLDYTVHVGDVLIFGGGLITFIMMFLKLRDIIRDLMKMVGTEHPPSGLLGDMRHVKEELGDHRDWLIAAGLDRRNGHERRTGDLKM